MKQFVQVVVVFVIGVVVVSASDLPTRLSHRQAEALELRTSALFNSTKKSIEQLRHSGFSQLVGPLEHQLVLVEALVVDLRARFVPNTLIDLEHLKLAEENLLRVGFQISELIHEQQQQQQGKAVLTQAQLVSKAESLITQANEIAAKASSAEARAINQEIGLVETLAKEVQTKTVVVTLRQEELQLDNHDRILQTLMERVKASL